MKVWRRDDLCPDGRSVSWHQSRKAALRQDPPPGGILESVEAYDIPTNRAGLVAWLNKQPITQTDNG